MEFSCVKTKLAHFCGKPHSQELLKKLQNDFVSQQAACDMTVGEVASNVEMTQHTTTSSQQVNGIERESTETGIFQEQPSESEPATDAPQRSPLPSTSLECNHTTTTEQIQNSIDRGSEASTSCGPSEATECDFDQSFTYSLSPTHSPPYGAGLPPEEWEQVCSSMDEYLTQTRGWSIVYPFLLSNCHYRCRIVL